MKKNYRYMVFITVILICVCSIFFITRNRNKSDHELAFTEDIAFFINQEESVSMGEFLLYAASITQSMEQTYGIDVWKETVTLNNGSKISYEELTKRQIVEQIRMTRLLCEKADEYGITLSEKEQKSISTDAKTYLESINKYNVGEKGIDLSTVLKVYKDNALAEKVHNHIISMVTDDKEGHFVKEYLMICKELSPKWAYETHANQIVLSELELGNSSENK